MEFVDNTRFRSVLIGLVGGLLRYISAVHCAQCGGKHALDLILQSPDRPRRVWFVWTSCMLLTST